MARPISGMDHSVAFTCLLEFDWFSRADERVNYKVTDALVNEWRERVATGSKIGCYELAQEIETDLRELQIANAAKLGLSANPVN